MRARQRRGLFVYLLAITAVLFACGRGPKPPETTPSPVGVRASLGQGLVKAGEATSLLARIDLEALTRPSHQRPKVNLALVVDTSGSMDGKAIADARKASLALLDALSRTDRLAVVTFDSTSALVLPSTEMADADLAAVRRKIEAIRARGTTDLAGGLGKAIAQVRANYVKDGVNRVVLLGDGVPNVGSGIREIAAQAGASGISITTLGLGDDYDETLMGEIAQRSGGRFHYVKDSARVASFFQEEIVRLNQVVARQATLEVLPGPGVHVSRVIGQRAVASAGGGFTVQLGDISLGDKREVIVELAASGAKAGATMEVLDAVLHFSEVGGDAEREERAFVGAKVTSDAEKVRASRDETVEQAAARAREAALTLEEIKRHRDGDGAAPPSHDEDAPAPPAPAPVTAPTPADHSAPLAAPKLSRRSPAARSLAPAELRKLHDDAMNVLQGGRHAH